VPVPQQTLKKSSPTDIWTTVSGDMLTGSVTLEGQYVQTSLLRHSNESALRFCSRAELDAPLSPRYGDCRVVFVSREARNGVFRRMETIDDLCQHEAEQSSVEDVRQLVASGSRFRAWLSNDSVDAETRTAANARLCSMRVDGEFITVDPVETTIDHRLDMDRDGLEVNTTAVWTGTTKNGVATPMHCDNWSKETQFGTIGNPKDRTGWSQTAVTGRVCSTILPFYCLSVPRYELEKLGVVLPPTTTTTTTKTETTTTTMPTNISPLSSTTTPTISTTSLSSSLSTSTISKQSPTSTPAIPLITTTTTTTTTNDTFSSISSTTSSSLPLILGIVGGIVVLFLIVGVIVVLILRSQPSTTTADNNNNTPLEQRSNNVHSTSEYGPLPQSELAYG
jgi:hypothetical protein